MSDLRYVLRRLGRAPGFTAVAVVTLALGIGATAVVLSVVNAVLLRPLPVGEPDRLVTLSEVRESGRIEHILSLPQYLAYRERTSTLSGLAAHSLDDATVTTPAGASVTLATWVSGNYFDVLRVTPATGRFFEAAEARGPGAAPVVVVSWDLWQQELEGARDVAGRTIQVNGRPLTVIGVAPRGFHGAFLGARPSVWLPVGLYGDLKPDSEPYAWDVMGWLFPFGRLGPGVERASAEAELSLVARLLGEEHAYFRDNGPVAVRLDRLSAIPPMMRDPVRGFMGLLLATAGLVLLIAVVNVMGMLLARAARRERETALRRALGAGRLELLRQAAVEGGVLGVLGGIGSLLVVLWTVPLLARIEPPLTGAFTVDVAPDLRVLGLVALVSVATGLVCGAASVVRAGGGTSLVRGGGISGGGRARLRRVLVAGQIALTVVLLVSTGLLVRTVQAAARTDHGFDPRGVVTAKVNVRLNGYEEERGRAFYAELLERLRGAAEVEGAALSSMIPLGLDWNQQVIRVPGHEPPPGEEGFAVGYSLVSERYFGTLGLPVLAGREFDERDADGPPVLVVNSAFQERFWPGESALGRSVSWSGEEARIVGVVADGTYRSFDEDSRPFAYAPMSQQYLPGVWLHVRAPGEPATSAATLRRAIAAVDRDVAPVSVDPLEDLLEARLFPQKLAAYFIAAFGGLGLVLATVGMFGILSYRVARRRREIGVRRALGASARGLMGLVLRDGFGLFLGGVAAGALLAALTARALGGLIHGVSPLDPVTYVAVAALLAGVVVLASLAPAHRAIRVDPTEVLRHE